MQVLQSILQGVTGALRRGGSRQRPNDGPTRFPRIGLPEIDSDHQSLCEAIDVIVWLASNRPEHLGQALQFFEEMASLHFEREEQLLDMAEMEDADQHRWEHGHFLETIAMFRDRLAEGAVLHGDELRRFLRDWIESHVFTDESLGTLVDRTDIRAALSTVGLRFCMDGLTRLLREEAV